MMPLKYKELHNKRKELKKSEERIEERFLNELKRLLPDPVLKKWFDYWFRRYFLLYIHKRPIALHSSTVVRVAPPESGKKWDYFNDMEEVMQLMKKLKGAWKEHIRITFRSFEENHCGDPPKKGEKLIVFSVNRLKPEVEIFIA